MPIKLLIAQDMGDRAQTIAAGARLNWPDCEMVIAHGGAEALARVLEQPPDLVVLDLSQPPDGFEVCRRIREHSQTPILIITACDTALDAVRALDLGADDHLTKPFDDRELRARMRALLRRAAGRPTPPRGPFVAGDLTLDFLTREARIKGVLVPLTSTEYRLLQELARRPDTVLSHQTLLERVWGGSHAHDTRYLKVFIRRLRRKLGDDAHNARYIRTEWGVGYRFVTSHERA